MMQNLFLYLIIQQVFYLFLNQFFSDNEKRNILKNICCQFDSKINDIIFVDDRLMIEIKDLKHTINIKNMGQGFQKYLTIIASMIYKKNIL